MKTFLNIFLFCLGLVVLSACAKDELEAPQTSASPNALIISEPESVSEDIDVTLSIGDDFTPVSAEVNDDGDDESAGTNPDSDKKK